MIPPNVQIETYNTDAEWMQARNGAGRIGASEVAALLGKSPYAGPWDIWIRKQGNDQAPKTEEQIRGNTWEPIVLYLYEQETGRPAIPPSMQHDRLIIRHPQEDWAIESPDAFTEDPEHGNGQVEAKTADYIHAQRWSEEQPVVIGPGWDAPWLFPVEYVLQAYWQLEVSRLAFVDVAVLLPHFQFRTYRLLPDPDLQAVLLDRVGTWREKHLIRGEEPAIDESNACARYYAGLPHEEPLRPATAEEERMAIELSGWQTMKAEAEAGEQRVKNQLAARLVDCKGILLAPAVGKKKPPRLCWEGGGRTWQEPKEGRWLERQPFLRLRGLDTKEK